MTACAPSVLSIIREVAGPQKRFAKSTTCLVFACNVIPTGVVIIRVEFGSVRNSLPFKTTIGLSHLEEVSISDLERVCIW